MRQQGESEAESAAKAKFPWCSVNFSQHEETSRPRSVIKHWLILVRCLIQHRPTLSAQGYRMMIWSMTYIYILMGGLCQNSLPLDPIHNAQRVIVLVHLTWPCQRKIGDYQSRGLPIITQRSPLVIWRLKTQEAENLSVPLCITSRQMQRFVWKFITKADFF